MLRGLAGRHGRTPLAGWLPRRLLDPLCAVGAALRLEGPGIAWRTRRRAVPGRRWTKAAPRALGLPVRRRRRRLRGWQIRYLGGLHRRPGIPLPRIRGRGRHIVGGRTRGDRLRRRRAGVRIFGRRLEIGFFGAGPAEISPQFVIAVGHCLSPPDVVPRGLRPYQVSTTSRPALRMRPHLCAGNREQTQLNVYDPLGRVQ